MARAQGPQNSAVLRIAGNFTFRAQWRLQFFAESPQFVQPQAAAGRLTLDRGGKSSFGAMLNPCFRWKMRINFASLSTPAQKRVLGFRYCWGHGCVSKIRRSLPHIP